jgi:putative acetyltransferase
MKEWKIRDGRDGDAEQLIELIGACWAEYPGIIFDVDRELPELRAIAAAFRKLDGRFWVVEVGSRVVGSVGAVPLASAHGMELRKLYVARHARRNGLGARLCGLVESEARARGASFVELWSDTRFADAHRLYERVGYVRGPETRELHDLSSSVEYYYRKTVPPEQRA